MKNNDSYFGGKSGNGTYQQIINEIPKCKIYLEPMVGGGGIFKNLNLPELTVINDIDSGLIDKYLHEGHGKNVLIFNKNYRDVCDIYDSSDTVIYFDPPYHFDTRKSKQKVYFSEWNNTDHIEFLDYVCSLKSNVIISHYPFYLYDLVLKNWRSKEFLSMTRRGQALEKVYMNFNKPDHLQDYRFLGENYTDRQRIKRQNSRLVKKIFSLPVQQRNKIISDLTISDLTILQ